MALVNDRLAITGISSLCKNMVHLRDIICIPHNKELDITARATLNELVSTYNESTIPIFVSIEPHKKTIKGFVATH